MGITKEKIASAHPLHLMVWENQHEELEAKLDLVEPKADVLEQLDPRGRTPLLLAVVLGRIECAVSLLKRGANAQFEHKTNWTVVHEAVCRGDPELLKVVLEYRDLQKRSQRGDLVPNLLKRLKDAPDFYVEMRWEFTSWVPLLTRMCPVNTHRVYKMGSNVRVDSNVAGAENEPLQEGVSVIFQGKDDCVKMMEIDHATKQVYSNVILSGSDKHNTLQDSRVYEKTVSYRLSNPAMISYVNLEKIAFERNKTGIWGWGSDKSEKVNNFDCKVFSATNVELVTKIRHEHLSESDKNRSDNVTNFQRILNTFGATETSESDGAGTYKQSEEAAQSLPEITLEEYFDSEVALGGRDIGRSKESRTKLNKFKATVWLCENYPLNLQEQVMPIVDIMALSSSQFNKLKDFIQMQIPAGFPVKIEIPMFHLVNASITFHNIFATEEPVRGVQTLTEENGRLACILDEDLFEPPPLYDIRMSVTPAPISSSDDDIFRWTMDDDLSGEAASRGDHSKMVDIYEALNVPRTTLKDVTPDSDTEEQLLQRAIEESLMMARQMENPDWRPFSFSDGAVAGAAGYVPPPSQTEGSHHDTARRSSSSEELQAVLDLSRKQVEEEDRMRREEEENFKKVLELSLKEQ